MSATRAPARKAKLERSCAQFSIRGPRRWPLSSFFVAVLILLILLPQLNYLVMLQSNRIRQRKTIFGDNLLPTPWHWHDNPLGPENHTTRRSLEILKCSFRRWSKFLPSNLPAANTPQQDEECPSYFHWIQKDLAPWKLTGITRHHIETAGQYAAFRVIIVNGKLYARYYYSCVQTRAVFTVWGLLLLLEKYKGQVPDVEILFDCMDRPHIEKSEVDADALGNPPPLFRYCSNSQHYDIPWPDWSFWGWSETKLEPWDQERAKIIRGSQKNDWKLKAHKAYWRGNTDVGSPLRVELVHCNNWTVSSKSDIYNQDWDEEREHGLQNSKLEDQCNHRYKIYAEGFAWSVSFKYILACGSPTLAISPGYYDFFMRGLVPWVHYVPVRPSQICAHELCGAIDKEVTSAETTPSKANQIGKAGQDFVSNEVGMKNVYDYMFHILRAYSALQQFKPSVPRSATEVTQDFILCLAQPHERLLLEQSRKHVPIDQGPCHMSMTPGDGFKDFGWEAEEQANKEWSAQNCTTK